MKKNFFLISILILIAAGLSIWLWLPQTPTDTETPKDAISPPATEKPQLLPITDISQQILPTSTQETSSSPSELPSPSPAPSVSPSPAPSVSPSPAPSVSPSPAPSSAPKAGWEVFSNKKFTIQYPTGWRAITQPGYSVLLVKLYPQSTPKIEGVEGEEGGGGVILSETHIEITAKAVSETFGNEWSASTTMNREVAGYAAHERKLSDSETMIQFLAKGLFVSIKISTIGEPDPELSPDAIEQIISTLKLHE